MVSEALIEALGEQRLEKAKKDSSSSKSRNTSLMNTHSQFNSQPAKRPKTIVRSGSLMISREEALKQLET